MGSPTFYWYPDGGTIAASREDTSLGETLTSLEEWHVVEREDAVGLSGRQGCTVVGMPRTAVRLTLERFTDASVARQLYALESHLARGGMCGFAADADDGWCGYAENTLDRGDTIIQTTGNLWYFGGSLAASDQLVVQGMGPEGNREITTIQSVSGDLITLSSALKFTYADQVVMVRARDCWPVLYWPASRQGSPALSTVRRMHWTLDLTLEEDLAVAAVLASDDSSQLLGTTTNLRGVPVGSVSTSILSGATVGPAIGGQSDLAVAPTAYAGNLASSYAVRFGRR